MMRGVIGISITPFTENYEIDKAGITKHVNFLMDNGLVRENGVLVITGSVGECMHLTSKERKQVIKLFISATKGKIPVIVGCNHTCIYEVIDLARYAKECGAAAIMLMPPFYFRPTEEVVLEWYRQVANSVDIGIYVYNNVVVPRIDISINLMSKLVQIENIVGVKDCTPNFRKFERMIRNFGDKISVTNGKQASWEPHATMLGSSGFISGIVNFAPHKIVDIWKSLDKKDYTEAMNLVKELRPVWDLLDEFDEKVKSIPAIKAATDMVGSSAGPGRVPFQPLNIEEKAKLERVLKNIGVL